MQTKLLEKYVFLKNRNLQLDGYNVYFNREIEIIDFISQLERPFILDYTDDKCFVRFVNLL
jgi:hypothetical protein